jgi:hypothetical protein
MESPAARRLFSQDCTTATDSRSRRRRHAAPLARRQRRALPWKARAAHEGQNRETHPDQHSSPGIQAGCMLLAALTCQSPGAPAARHADPAPRRSGLCPGVGQADCQAGGPGRAGSVGKGAAGPAPPARPGPAEGVVRGGRGPAGPAAHPEGAVRANLDIEPPEALWPAIKGQAASLARVRGHPLHGAGDHRANSRGS